MIRYDTCDVAERVAEITKGTGCDVVYDSVGRSTFEGSLRSLRPRDTLALFGQSELDVRIGARFALERAEDAHRALEARLTSGKVLLTA